MKSKKAMSGVVTSVILVALVLIAIGVVWAVISNLISDKSGDINLDAKCMKVIVRPVTANCTTVGATSDCSVTLKRTDGGDELTGVKLVFVNATGSDIVDVPGNIEPLATITPPESNVELSDVQRVEVSVYFTDAAGEEHLCSQSTTYNL